MEDLGFAERGTAWKEVMAGNLRPGRGPSRQSRRGTQELRAPDRGHRSPDAVRVLAAAPAPGATRAPDRHGDRRWPHPRSHPQPRRRTRRVRELRGRGGHGTVGLRWRRSSRARHGRRTRTRPPFASWPATSPPVRWPRGRRLMTSPGEVPREAIAAMAAADLFRVTIGEQWGGLGMGDVEAAIVLEEIARHDVSTAICCQLAFNGPARGIEHLGSAALKDRWLPAVANGEAIISIGITEPDAGSAVQSMRTALKPDGDGWQTRRLQELLDPWPRRRRCSGLVPVAGWRGRQGDRCGDRAHGPSGGGADRPAPGNGDPCRHRVGDRVRRRGHHRGRCAGGRRPVVARAVQTAAVPPQP